MIVLKECVLDGRHQQFNPKTRPSKQCEFCNYHVDKSLISQGCQSGSVVIVVQGLQVVQVVMGVQGVKVVKVAMVMVKVAKVVNTEGLPCSGRCSPTARKVLTCSWQRRVST